jgi:hypothetical protein
MRYSYLYIRTGKILTKEQLCLCQYKDKDMERMIEELCFDFLAETGNLHVLQNIQMISEAQPASRSMGNSESYPGVKLVGHEAHHPPLSSAEAKNGQNYITKTHIPSRHAQR